MSDKKEVTFDDAVLIHRNVPGQHSDNETCFCNPIKATLRNGLEKIYEEYPDLIPCKH